MRCRSSLCDDTATPEISTLSLHDALPILLRTRRAPWRGISACRLQTSPTVRISVLCRADPTLASSSGRPKCRDRKSTRLNSSHLGISYAVFCLKKKNIEYIDLNFERIRAH